MGEQTWELPSSRPNALSKMLAGNTRTEKLNQV
jgi:hypothetical protein